MAWCATLAENRQNGVCRILNRLGRIVTIRQMLNQVRDQRVHLLFRFHDATHASQAASARASRQRRHTHSPIRTVTIIASTGGAHERGRNPGFPYHTLPDWLRLAPNPSKPMLITASSRPSTRTSDGGREGKTVNRQANKTRFNEP